MKERTFHSATVKPTSSANRAKAEGQAVKPCLKRWLKKQRANTGQLEEVADLARPTESSTERDSDTTLLRSEVREKGLLLGQTTDLYSKQSLSSSTEERKAGPFMKTSLPHCFDRIQKVETPLSIQI